jgi:hypothetical protein
MNLFLQNEYVKIETFIFTLNGQVHIL